MTSCLAYYLFGAEPWFPAMVGGQGKCTSLYDPYPNWPEAKRTELEIFFMIQLGVHVFSVFELVVIKRKTERKFYEILLHHFMASSLIFFSMMCNEITAGTMILIVHDFSDIFIAFARAYFDMRFTKVRPFINAESICSSPDSGCLAAFLDLHANNRIPILFASKCIHQQANCTWWLVHDLLPVPVSADYGLCAVRHAHLLDFLHHQVRH